MLLRVLRLYQIQTEERLLGMGTAGKQRKERGEKAMNSLHIIGNLVKDPELRTTATGLSVCSFTVAVNRRKTQNQQQPEADYFNVTAWRERGETCAKYLSKGKKVSVVGPVSVRTWESNGKHGASLEVTADEVEFLTPRAESQPAQQRQVDQHTQMEVVETDDLPF